MTKRFTKILCAFLAFVMCLGTVPAFAIGDVAEASLRDETTWPITKTANGLDSNDQTDVTLTVPGVLEGAIDVVFILGGGMTANMETIESAISVFKPAMESGKATVRMGLISLEKGKEIILDLNSDEAVLDPATYVDFVTEKFDSINDLPGGSTNLHSQMLEAQKMLAEEKLAKAENKYVFVLATGRTYWFDDANGEQATVVNQNGGKYYWGNYLWQNQRGRNTSLYMIPARYNNSYEAFYKDIEKMVLRDGDTYVYTPHFDANDYSAYANWYADNGTDLYISKQRHGLGLVAPTVDNFINGAMNGIGRLFDDNQTILEDVSKYTLNHALNYERAQYECVQVWKQLIASGYNCYSICSESPNYQSDSVNIKSKGYTGSSTIQLGHAFMDYLAELAGQGKAPVVWDYERDEDGNVVFHPDYPDKKGNYNYALTTLNENFFSSISDDMLYTTSINTTVEDFIGKNENGNFEFIEKAECIKLVVGGVDYVTAMVENTDTAEGSSYTFTAPGADEPTFWLDYYYGDGKTTERFVWTFGEDVHMQKLASLTYKLQLTEKQEEAGTYEVPTNIKAILHPVDSDGHKHPDQIFPVPTVEYTVTPYDVDIVIALGAGIAKYDKDYVSSNGESYTNTYDSIISLVEPLIKQGITVKLGLVAVEHYDDVAMELTALDADNYERIIQSGLETIQNMPAGPTNLHGNIEAAKAMLDADKTVPAANKFFYVIATGRTYNYDNEQGVPTTIVNKTKLKGDTYYYWGHYLWQSQRGRHTSLYMIPDRYNNDFAAYWADVEKWVKADGDTYAYSFTDAYNVNDPQWFNTFFDANNKDAKYLGLASSRFGWIMNPLTNSGHAGISDAVNPNHALSYERAQYEAYQTYQEMEAAGYNCYALCSENTSYQNNSPYIKVQKYTGTSTIQLGHSFMNFLAGEDQNYEAPLLFVMTDPNTGASDVATNFFAPVDTTKLVKSTTKALEFKGITYNIKVSYGTIAYITVEAEGDVTYEWHVKTSGGEEYVSAIDTETYKVVMDGTYDEQQVYCIITDELGNKKTTDTVTLILSH